MIIETERLILRPWSDADREEYARFNADPQVRRFYPNLNTAEQTNEWIDKYIERWAVDGTSFFALERKSDGAFIGDAGVSRLDEEVPGNPEFEAGWLTGKEYWGNGYVPEAMRAALDFAWGLLDVPEIVAFTYVGNLPSRRVMEKIGMRHDPSRDFMHSRVPVGHRLRPHVLYSIANPRRVSARS